MAQLRRGIGKYLRKIREQKRIALDQVIAELELLKIFCSKSALSRFERDLSPGRVDVFAGLCKIYKISADDVIFRGKKN